MKIQVHQGTFIKDPSTSDLGRKIVSFGIKLMDELGYEQFTFKKLATNIDSTEASVYRYFEGKHKMLLYFISWYWNWTEYRLAMSLSNIDSPIERLNRSLTIITTETKEDGNFVHINETKLQRIVNVESSKAYLTKAVDDVNKDGVFADYKRIVGHIADIVLEINPAYKYPHMLISTVIEGAHHERFFAEHLPRLTDKIKGEDSIKCFFEDLVHKTLNIPTS
ncbi:TetR/AcrR family transcriptional regulator [Salibacteraceae bacterium]|nr:TetR/AcrR family transcriptional regulator [Salibacteraceae bacterium]